MISVIQTGDGRSQGHNVYAVPDLMRAQALNRLRISHAIAATQSCHSVDLRKGARHDQIWMVPDHRYYAFIVGAVSVMKISFVHQNRGFLRNFADELAECVPWGDAGSGIVRIAYIDQSLTGGRRHFRKIVTQARSEGNFND